MSTIDALREEGSGDPGTERGTAPVRTGRTVDVGVSRAELAMARSALARFAVAGDHSPFGRRAVSSVAARLDLVDGWFEDREALDVRLDAAAVGLLVLAEYAVADYYRRYDHPRSAEDHRAVGGKLLGTLATQQPEYAAALREAL